MKKKIRLWKILWIGFLMPPSGCIAPNPFLQADGATDAESIEDAMPDVRFDLVEPEDLAPLLDLGPPRPPSCDDLPWTCGPNKNEDCCKYLPIIGGVFLRSYDAAADAFYSDMSNAARVSDFRLDRFEATVGRFRKFMNAGYGTQDAPPIHGNGAGTMPGTGWDRAWNIRLAADTAALRAQLRCDPNHQTWTDAPGANENLPINCVDWFEAFAFCVWDGGRLPTEAEWNYAAAGGSEQRSYPWSSPPASTAIDDTLAVYCGMTCAIQNVGSRSPKGDGRWGHADLAGNMWEWVFDGYAPYGNPCSDCANVISSGNRVLRGGNFSASTANLTSNPLRTAARPNVTPLNRDNSSGFRCARRP